MAHKGEVDMRSALLVFVLFASLVIGADVPLRVGGSETVPEWTIGKLKVDAPKASAAYVWDIIPVHPLADDAASIVELGNEVLFTGPPGKYRFVCTEILIVDGKPVVNRQRSTVTITPSDKPTPVPPNPTPPGPEPAPVTKQGYYIIAVEETSQAANNRAAYFTDPTLRQRVKDGGHKWLVFDKDVVDANGVRPRDLVFYLERAKGKTLPQLFLVGLSDSKIHYEGDMPKSAADLVALLGKVGG